MPQSMSGGSVGRGAGAQRRGNWAANGHRLCRSAGADRAPTTAWGVTGRRVTGPEQGFGRLWQRTYTCPIGDVRPRRSEAIAEWRAHFGEFWPGRQPVLRRVEGINPGDVAPIAVAAGGGLKLTTGVLVLYADDESFSFMTPEGHMFAGMITFSAHENAGGTVLQTQVLDPAQRPALRAGHGRDEADGGPLLGRHHAQPRQRLGAVGCNVDVTSIVVDRKRLWRNARNIRYNAGVRSVLHLAAAPFAAARPRSAAPDCNRRTD